MVSPKLHESAGADGVIEPCFEAVFILGGFQGRHCIAAKVAQTTRFPISSSIEVE